MLLPRFLFVTAIAGSMPACTATKLAGTIEGEPVCEDFSLGGGNTMKGSVRLPVKVSILEDDEPLWERLVFGKRKADDKSSVFAIADSDEEYIVRWAQCPNAFAPQPVDAANKTTDRTGSYTCGEAKPYADTKLIVKAGDAKSRVIQWVAPPDPSCWTSSAVPTASASAAPTSSASAPPPPPPPPPPSAAPSASAATSAAPATSGSAAVNAP